MSVRQALLVVTRSQSVTSNIRATDLIGKIRMWLFKQGEGSTVIPSVGFQGVPLTLSTFDPYLIELHQIRVADLWEFITTLDWHVFGVTLLYQDDHATTTNAMSLGHRWEDIERRERVLRVG